MRGGVLGQWQVHWVEMVAFLQEPHLGSHATSGLRPSHERPAQVERWEEVTPETRELRQDYRNP